jgi:ribonuclease P protein component
MRLARLTQRKEFRAAAEHGRRFRSSAFMAQVRDAAPDEPRKDGGPVALRLGLTASRKTGNAVKRNRIRRRLREAAKQALASQSERPCDIVVIARSDVLTAQFKTLVADLSIAIDRAKPHKPREATFADRRRPLPKRGAPSQA